jgi:hypothetical protein
MVQKEIADLLDVSQSTIGKQDYFFFFSVRERIGSHNSTNSCANLIKVFSSSTGLLFK